MDVAEKDGVNDAVRLCERVTDAENDGDGDVEPDRELVPVLDDDSVLVSVGDVEPVAVTDRVGVVVVDVL